MRIMSAKIRPAKKVHFGYIAPISYLHKVPEDESFHLILAHLLDNEKYVNFYNKRRYIGDYILLDNSAFEFKRPIEADELLKLIDKSGINANCLVAPDYPFQSGIKTIKSTEKFVKQLQEKGLSYDVMAVPQSEKGDWQDWLNCYNELASIDGVTHIGMSCLGTVNAFCEITRTTNVMINRILASMTLFQKKYYQPNIWHHYLGIGDINEIIIQREIGIINSMDTSSPIWCGINMLQYNENFRGFDKNEIKIPVDFNVKKTKETLKAKQISHIIDTNINEIKILTR